MRFVRLIVANKETVLPNILITGFSPFDGRIVNASWVAARTYAAASHLEIPVVWGAPITRLREAIARHKPSTIISLGEGHEGYFTVETRAQNVRKHRADNLGEFPKSVIMGDGPDCRIASIDAGFLQAELAAQDIPFRISEDAGQFLCEETLYCLETLRLEENNVEKVTFVHLPPHGTSVQYQNTESVVDENLLKDFLGRLVEAVQKLKVIGTC